MSSLFNGSMGQSGVDTGDIPASLRFRGRSVNAYTSRTFGTPTSQNSWAYSVWVKFSEMPNGANYQPLLSAGAVATNTWPGEMLFLYQDGTLAYYAASSGGTNNVSKRSTRVFRDPTSWVHIFVRKTAAANSGLTFVRLWVNNEEVTSWAVNAYTGTQASVPDYINVASTLHTGGRNFTGENLNGYKARECFVDNGGSLLPTDFAYQNTEINAWVSKSASAVKAVVDAGGTNSFMLDFHDATSLTTLGYDYSSKGNNWTLNNFSLTAGTSYDRMLDVPGNSYCTLNSVFPNPATFTVSDGNLSYVSPSSNFGLIHGTMPFPSSGTWWFEVTCVNNVTYPHIGIDQAPRAVSASSYLGENATGYAYLGSGQKYTNAAGSAYGASYTTGDVIGVMFDATNGTLSFYKQTGGTGSFSAQGTAFTGLTSGTYFPALSDTGTNTVSLALNFGQRTFNYVTQHGALPSSAKALCQRNMPDPAILNPEKHFDVVTYTGNAATKSITGLLFSPGLVEMKSRGRALDWAYYDSVRGVEKRLESNNTDAEVTGDTTGLTAFNSDGWTMGALDQINGTTATNSFVGSAWKAGGAAVTNNAGSISSQVSANVTAGFSIVTATSNGANPFTVGHGLGQTPAFYIVKNRDIVDGWYCWHKNLASATDSYLLLNGTGATTTAAGIWGAGANSTTLGIRGSSIAANGQKIVAYCFAEIAGFSKIFSYTGNGSADGPFVHCGFKPKFVLIKRSDAAGPWVIHDAARAPYNFSGPEISANVSSAEVGSVERMDFLANGFKQRGTAGSDYNTSGGTYVGIAFADVPAKYSLAR